MQKSYFFRIAIVAVFSFIAIGTFAYVNAQTDESGQTEVGSVNSSGSTDNGISYPVAELGGCTSKDDCRSYCNDTANINACVTFAKAHGLINQEEASRAQKFAQQLQSGSTPGKCLSPDSCKSYCSKTSHIDECVAFAKQHRMEDDVEVKGAQRIAAYLKTGGSLPGGCTSKDSCKTYCEDFSHAEECIAFAQKAGLNVQTGSEGKNVVPPGQFQKFIQLVKEKKTPGGCSSQADCKSYCSNADHSAECMSFGKEAGLITQEHIGRIEKLGGKGPGGCTSEDSCKAYCNDSTHQQECLSFAKEHKVLDDDDLERSKDGLVRLKEGLSQAPKEVAQCLQSTLGQNVIDKVQSGEFTPGPEIGDSMHKCFERFGEKSDPSEPFKKVPPAIASCIREKIGDDFDGIRSGKDELTPESADTMRVCVQRNQLEQKSQRVERDNENLLNYIQTAPPKVSVCLKEGLGGTYNQLLSGQANPEDTGGKIKEQLKECFKEFNTERPMKPILMKQGKDSKDSDSKESESRPARSSSIKEESSTPLPSNIASCVKQVLGRDALDKGTSSPEVQQQIAICKSAVQESSKPSEQKEDEKKEPQQEP